MSKGNKWTNLFKNRGFWDAVVLLTNVIVYNFTGKEVGTELLVLVDTGYVMAGAIIGIINAIHA
jgi:hypothetical protein